MILDQSLECTNLICNMYINIGLSDYLPWPRDCVSEAVLQDARAAS